MNASSENAEKPRVIFALTVLRIVVGIIMAAHGYDKLTHLAQWQSTVHALGIPWPGVSSYVAIAGELLGGLGLIVGLLTPIAAFGVLCSMVVAIGSAHISHGLFARNHGFEYPLTILCVALLFVLRGAGPVSLDAALHWVRLRPGSRHARAAHS